MPAENVKPSIPAPAAAAFLHLMYGHINAIEQSIGWKENGFDFVAGKKMLWSVLEAIESSLPAKRHSPEFKALVEAARRAKDD